MCWFLFLWAACTIFEAHWYYDPSSTNTKPQTYEQTLLELWDYAQAQGIPFRSLQLDSWWYYKVRIF